MYLAALLLFSAPCQNASALTIGDKAPCTGTLVPDLALISLIDDAEKCAVNLKACEEISGHDRALFLQKQKKHAELLSIETKKAQALSDALDEALRETRYFWYEHPAFVASISIVMTAALAVGVYALSLELSL